MGMQDSTDGPIYDLMFKEKKNVLVLIDSQHLHLGFLVNEIRY